MKRLCIVPFTNQEYPLVQYLASDYDICALVSPKGIGSSGVDIGIFRNEGEKGYTLLNSIEEGIRCSDVVLISDVSPERQSLYAFAIKALETAAAEKKEIISFLELNDEQADSYKKLLTENQKKCYFYQPDLFEEETENTTLYKLNVPVLYISETIPRCGGYDVFLKLINRFQRDGKKVLALSEDKYNELFSMHTVKFRDGTDLRAMVYRLNHIVYTLAQKVHPDIILIKLPEPMMKYDDENPFDFGLTAYMVSQAVPGDGCIYCTYTGTPYMGFWDPVNDSVLAKFGYPILAVQVSNQIIDSTSQSGVPTLYVQPHKTLSEIHLLNQYNNLQFYYISDEEGFDDLHCQIVNEFLKLPYGVI